jgi:hypothetical protein
MFSKLARIDAGRHFLPALAPARHNDNRLDGRRAAARRPRLPCYWRPGATNGRLECFWQIAPADEVSAEAPGPSFVTPGFMITAALPAVASSAVTRRRTDGRAA